VELVVKYKVWFESRKGDFILGPGGVRLLEAVDRLGSVRKASIECGWSYKKALDYINSLEENLGFKATIRKRGGKGGGGTILTEEAKKLVLKYKTIYTKIKEIIEEYDC